MKPPAIIALVIVVAGIAGLALYRVTYQHQPDAQKEGVFSKTPDHSEQALVPHSPITDIQAQALARKSWAEKAGKPIPASARVTVARTGNIITVTFYPEKPDPEPKPGGDFIAQVDIDAKSGSVTAMRISA